MQLASVSKLLTRTAVAIVAIFVLADLSSANPAQRLPPPWYYIHHHSGFVRLEVETSDPQALQSDELVD